LNLVFLACPCCGYATLETRGDFEICPICFWEDDGQDDVDAAESKGGPNGSSLVEARRSFLLSGAAHADDLSAVRAPSTEDRRLRFFRLVDDVVREEPPARS
jgi:hypothetical protein